jgi:hypothetical protein
VEAARSSSHVANSTNIVIDSNIFFNAGNADRKTKYALEFITVFLN